MDSSSDEEDEDDAEGTESAAALLGTSFSSPGETSSPSTDSVISGGGILALSEASLASLQHPLSVAWA